MAKPKQVNVHEAKTHFSKLLARVEKGEHVIIARDGKPVAELRPLQEQPKERRLGIDRGKVWIADDFDAPLPDEVLSGFR